MKLVGIEAARGFAALLVVALHASTMLAGARYFGAMPFAGIFKFAHAGVDFFFVLSGFIIYYIHARDIGRRDQLASYAWKRFVRIYPTYWVMLALMGALLVVSPTLAREERQIGNILTSILLLPWDVGPILVVAWSLKHEILFYGLFGLLFLDRRLGIAALGIWALLILWNIGTTMITGTPWFGGILGDLVFRIFNIEFFFGILVAHIVLAGRIWRPNAMIAVGLLLFLGTGILESWGPRMPNEWPPLHLAYGAGAAMTLYGLAAAQSAGRLHVPRILVAVGAASYSLYLVHVIVILFLQQALLLLRPHVVLTAELWFVIFVGVSIAASLVFARIVEQPLMRRLRARRTAPAPATSSV